MPPRLSVIMNCYNGDRYLRQAIDSVFLQDFTDWEIIFWDNQSTDESAAIARTYKDPRFKYFYSDKHELLHDARKSALAKATGVWICFLDTDDYWLPGKLKSQFDIIEESEKRSEQLAFVYGRSRIISPEGEIDPPFVNQPLPQGMIFDQLIKTNFVPLLTVLVKREIFDEVGGIDPTISQAGDYSAWLRITQKYPVRALQPYCAVYRWHPDNLSQKKAMTLLYETYVLKFWRYHYFDWELITSTFHMFYRWMLSKVVFVARPLKKILGRKLGRNGAH